MFERTLLIANLHSGKMRAKKYLPEIAEIFCRAETALSLHITRCPMDAAEVVKARGKEFDLIVACGGDGTLNEVVTGALAVDYSGAVGFIPCGTTNDLANTLSLSKDPLQAARDITGREAKFLDFGAFNGDRCVTYIASFGAFTEVSYATGQKAKNAFGHLAYVANGVGAAMKIRTYHVKAECDGEEFEGDYIFGAVANSLSVGGIVKLKPEIVDLADGMHEMLLVKKPKNPAQLAKIIHDVTHSTFTGENLIFRKGARIRFTCEEVIPWCVDGEYAGDHTEVEIRNLHEKIRIVRP